MNYPKSITKDDINRLPPQEFTGEIFVITDPASAIDAAKKLASFPLLGFDTETRPSFHADQQFKVSLLQLVTDHEAYLFRLKETGLPSELCQVLSNPAIIKVGVAIRDDIKSLQKITPFNAEGFVDIATEAAKRGFKNFGLRALTAIFLQTKLSKTAKLTNWDHERLTRSQLHYAANDGVVSLGIYRRLMELPVH